MRTSQGIYLMNPFIIYGILITLFLGWVHAFFDFTIFGKKALRKKKELVMLFIVINSVLAAIVFCVLMIATDIGFWKAVISSIIGLPFFLKSKMFTVKEISIGPELVYQPFLDYVMLEIGRVDFDEKSKFHRMLNSLSLEKLEEHVQLLTESFNPPKHREEITKAYERARDLMPKPKKITLQSIIIKYCNEEQITNIAKGGNK